MTDQPGNPGGTPPSGDSEPPELRGVDLARRALEEARAADRKSVV